MQAGSWASGTAAGLHSDPNPSVAGLRGMEGSSRLRKRKDMQEVRQRGGKRTQEAPQGTTPGERAYVPVQVKSPAAGCWLQRRKQQAVPVDAWLVVAPGSNAPPRRVPEAKCPKAATRQWARMSGQLQPRETGPVPPRECLPRQNPVPSRAQRGCSPLAPALAVCVTHDHARLAGSALSMCAAACPAFVDAAMTSNR